MNYRRTSFGSLEPSSATRCSWTFEICFKTVSSVSKVKTLKQETGSRARLHSVSDLVRYSTVTTISKKSGESAVAAATAAVTASEYTLQMHR